MSDNEKRRDRARAAMQAVPDVYSENEEGIADAISDLTHLAAAQGVDVAALLDRCRRNFEAETADAQAPERYAIPVVLEAASADAAWEALRRTAGDLEGNGEPDCLYIGAPWRGIPAEAEDLGAEHLELAMSVPNGGGRFARITAVLRPCE